MAQHSYGITWLLSRAIWHTHLTGQSHIYLVHRHLEKACSVHAFVSPMRHKLPWVFGCWCLVWGKQTLGSSFPGKFTLVNQVNQGPDSSLNVLTHILGRAGILQLSYDSCLCTDEGKERARFDTTIPVGVATYFSMCVRYMCGSVHAVACVYRLKKSLLESVLSFHHVGPGPKTQGIRSGSQCLYSPSHLAGLPLVLLTNFSAIDNEMLVGFSIKADLHFCKTLTKMSSLRNI